MATFIENGDLEMFDTLDLADTLDTLDGDQIINMNNARACLGVRTIERLIGDDRAEVRFDIYAGTVKTAGGEYTVQATDTASAFIQAMLDRQLNGPNDDEYFGIEVRELRDELVPFLQENVYYRSLQD